VGEDHREQPLLLDPRRTETTELADQHRLIRPGADVFLLFGVVNAQFGERLVRLGRMQRTSWDGGARGGGRRRWPTVHRSIEQQCVSMLIASAIFPLANTRTSCLVRQSQSSHSISGRCLADSSRNIRNIAVTPERFHNARDSLGLCVIEPQNSRRNTPPHDHAERAGNTFGELDMYRFGLCLAHAAKDNGVQAQWRLLQQESGSRYVYSAPGQ